MARQLSPNSWLNFANARGGNARWWSQRTYDAAHPNLTQYGGLCAALCLVFLKESMIGHNRNATIQHIQSNWGEAEVNNVRDRQAAYPATYIADFVTEHGGSTPVMNQLASPTQDDVAGLMGHQGWQYIAMSTGVAGAAGHSVALDTSQGGTGDFYFFDPNHGIARFQAPAPGARMSKFIFEFTYWSYSELRPVWLVFSWI